MLLLKQTKQRDTMLIRIHPSLTRNKKDEDDNVIWIEDTVESALYKIHAQILAICRKLKIDL